MNRYFFHLRHADVIVADEEGDEFDSLDEAKSSAVDAVRELVADLIKRGESVNDDYMDVTDEGGRQYFSVSFLEVVKAQLRN